MLTMLTALCHMVVKYVAFATQKSLIMRTLYKPEVSVFESRHQLFSKVNVLKSSIKILTFLEILYLYLEIRTGGEELSDMLVERRTV